MRLPICSLAAFLLLTLLPISCSRKSITGVEVDSKLKAYILPKSKAMVGLDLDKIKQTDFYKRHQAQLALPQLNQLSEKILVDPRRDLSFVLGSWDGAQVLIATHGTFDSAAVEKRLGAMAKAEKYHDLSFFGDGKNDVAFLPKGVALAGSALQLKRAVDENATGGGGIPEDLQLQLARIKKGSEAWLVSSGVISLDQLAIRSDTSTMLSNISGYINATAIGVTLTSGAAVDAHISCISEEGSQRVHDALRGVIGLARLSTKDDQMDQLKMWDSIHIEKQGKDVHIDAELTPELADKLIKALPALARRF